MISLPCGVLTTPPASLVLLPLVWRGSGDRTSDLVPFLHQILRFFCSFPNIGIKSLCVLYFTCDPFLNTDSQWTFRAACCFCFPGHWKKRRTSQTASLLTPADVTVARRESCHSMHICDQLYAAKANQAQPWTSCFVNHIYTTTSSQD